MAFAPRRGCTIRRVYLPVRAQCTQCSLACARDPVSANPATGLAAISSRARSRKPPGRPAARTVMPGTVPGDSGMPNSPASACAVRLTPGQEDVLGLRVAAALIDLALLAGLFLIIASAAGLVTAAGGSFSILLRSAWWAACAAQLPPQRFPRPS